MFLGRGVVSTNKKVIYTKIQIDFDLLCKSKVFVAIGKALENDIFYIINDPQNQTYFAQKMG